MLIPNFKTFKGITLVEYIVAMAIGLIVLAAIMQAFVSSKISQQVNHGLALVQQNGRFAISILEQSIRMAGFQDRDLRSGALSDAIWLEPLDANVPTPGESVTVSFGTGTQSAFADCRGQLAPPNDILRITFARSQDHELLCTSLSNQSGELVTTSVVGGVEDMRVRFGEDTDGDGYANRFRRPDALANANHVVAVRLCLLLSSIDLTDTQTHSYVDCAGKEITTDDGKLRRSFSTTVSLRNRV